MLKLLIFVAVVADALVPVGRRELLALVAFENAIPEAATYSDRPKRRGPQPPDLGVKLRDDLDEPELKVCGGAPNCFSTTPDDVAPEHTIPRWRPKGDDAFNQLRNVLRNYEPGQNGIDGGGFKIIDEKDGYIYVVFESLKNGYYDDVEFALTENNDLNVRSSSRVGYLDFQVNAKRLNYISAKLRALGWDAPAITPTTHPDYFEKNAPNRDQVPPSSVFTR